MTWTATADDLGSAPVYQFSVAKDGGTPQVYRDFSPLSSFIWNPPQEGSYDVQVIVKAGYDLATGESATASYQAQSRVVGDEPWSAP